MLLYADVVAAAKKRCQGFKSRRSLTDWTGILLGASDEEILKEAALQSMTLLTFALKTITTLLRNWGERGVNHGGVIFVDNKSFAQNDIGGILKLLADLWEIQEKDDWKNRCFFSHQSHEQHSMKMCTTRGTT